MFFGLIDGTGRGFKARVNEKFRLETQTVIRSAEEDAALQGDAYLCGSGPVALTSGNESAVYFFKNNEDKDVIIRNFVFNTTAVSGGNGSADAVFLLRLYSNPDSISLSTDIPPSNNNFGSSQTLSAVSQFGAEGSGVIGGTPAGATFAPQKEFTTLPLSWVVPKGSSFAITVQPDTSNNNTQVNIFLDAYLREVE
jgi:hypothetical protein